MMYKKIISIGLVLALFASCQREATNHESELLIIFEQLRKDSDYTFLKTLEPSDADIKHIFNSDVSILKVQTYSRERWEQMSNTILCVKGRE